MPVLLLMLVPQQGRRLLLEAGLRRSWEPCTGARLLWFSVARRKGAADLIAQWATDPSAVAVEDLSHQERVAFPSARRTTAV